MTRGSFDCSTCGLTILTGHSRGSLPHAQVLSTITRDAVFNAHVATPFEQMA